MKVHSVVRETPPVEFVPVTITVTFVSLKEVEEIKKALGPLTVGYELYSALTQIIKEERE